MYSIRNEMQFNNKNDFSLHIEKTAEDKEISCIQVILEYCDENDLEFTAIKKLVNQSLSNKLDLEGRELGLMTNVVATEVPLF